MKLLIKKNYVLLMFFAPLEVDLGDTTERFFCQFIGTKGDWPFLRASYQLRSGFTSLRICHLCDGQDLNGLYLFLKASFLLVSSGLICMGYYSSVLE